MKVLQSRSFEKKSKGSENKIKGYWTSKSRGYWIILLLVRRKKVVFEEFLSTNSISKLYNTYYPTSLLVMPWN